jgi:hypothetical protein
MRGNIYCEVKIPFLTDILNYYIFAGRIFSFTPHFHQ